MYDYSNKSGTKGIFCNIKISGDNEFKGLMTKYFCRTSAKTKYPESTNGVAAIITVEEGRVIPGGKVILDLPSGKVEDFVIAIEKGGRKVDLAEIGQKVGLCFRDAKLETFGLGGANAKF